MNPLKIISGGQTGAECAALDCAIANGLEHGGWCPKGRKAEDGPIDTRYQLRETPISSPVQRLEWNVRDSDGTVIFSMDKHPSENSLLTLVFAQKGEKPWLFLSAAADEDAPQRLARFIEHNNIRVLNVAGPSASREPKVERFVTATLHRLFNLAYIYVVQSHGEADSLKLLLEMTINPACIVRPFSDPKEALQSFATANCKPDLLITGWLFKTISGNELLQECKKLKPSLKVILFALSIRPEMEMWFENQPFRPDAYIKKTLDVYFDPLLTATRRLLRVN